jgi:hypothetical protein
VKKNWRAKISCNCTFKFLNVPIFENSKEGTFILISNFLCALCMLPKTRVMLCMVYVYPFSSLIAYPGLDLGIFIIISLQLTERNLQCFSCTLLTNSSLLLYLLYSIFLRRTTIQAWVNY